MKTWIHGIATLSYKRLAFPRTTFRGCCTGTQAHEQTTLVGNVRFQKIIFTCVFRNEMVHRIDCSELSDLAVLQCLSDKRYKLPVTSFKRFHRFSLQDLDTYAAFLDDVKFPLELKWRRVLERCIVARAMCHTVSRI